MSIASTIKEKSLGAAWLIDSIFVLACGIPLVGVFFQVAFRFYYGGEIGEPCSKTDGPVTETGLLLEQFFKKQPLNPLNRLQLATGILFPFMFMPESLWRAPYYLIGSPVVLVFYDIGWRGLGYVIGLLSGLYRKAHPKQAEPENPNQSNTTQPTQNQTPAPSSTLPKAEDVTAKQPTVTPAHENAKIPGSVLPSSQDAPETVSRPTNEPKP